MKRKESIVDYLQCDISSFEFQDLKDIIIEKNNCVNCGACIAICPRLELQQNKPVICNYDPACSLCYKYCSRTYFPKKDLENKLLGDTPYQDSFLGNYQEIIAAKSTDKKILENAQNGGIVSTILYHLLENNIVDGILLTKRDKDWFPKPYIAKDPEDILEIGGSIYSVAPTLSGYKEAVEELKLKRLCYVGMPCHLPAVRKFQLAPPLSKDYGIFTVIIGLFCSANYSYKALTDLCRMKLNLSLKEIKKFDVSKGNLTTITNNDELYKIPIRETIPYHYLSCQYCKDYTAELADLSIGSVGALSDNLNSIIIRTKEAYSLIQDLKKAKKIEISNQLDINKIRNASSKKKLRIFPIDDGIKQTLSSLSLNDEEIQVFIAILSLGGSDFVTLTNVLSLSDDLIHNALYRLKNKLWIYSEKTLYKAFNPALIFKGELSRMRDMINKLKEIIKKNVLPELETLFFQNNINDIKNYDNLYTFI